MLAQNLGAALVHQARCSADLAVAVVGKVLPGKVDQARVPLQQGQELQAQRPGWPA
jgi:hypothetical protein